MADRPDKWEARHRRNVERYQRLIDDIYNEAVREAASLTPMLGNFSPDRPFSFDDFPATRQRLKKLLDTLKNSVEAAIVNGVNSEWALADDRNDELCRKVFGGNAGSLTDERRKRYYSDNDKAREAFLARRERGLNLSDRVWNYTDQFKEEIEAGLDLGLRDGLSADEMSRQLRQYLKYPDKLFRRVRDEHGVLHLSKRAKAFRPGRGVYRSSYKNARRLAATETNIAYRTADHTRRQQLDFVTGIEVRLSGNHPVTDICDSLKGRYPKEFKFTGWHPLCRCHTVSVLKTEEEMSGDDRRIMAGEEPLPPEQSANAVKDVPDNFKGWVKDNAARIARAKSLPYFLKDNPLQLKRYVPKAHEAMVENALSDAKAAAAGFQKRVAAIAGRLGATVTPVNLKSAESTWRKINSKETEHIGDIRDLVRNTIIVDNPDDIDRIVEEIRKQFVIPYGDRGKRRIKRQDTPMGYTGMLVNVQLKGVQGEIQVNIPQMIYAKDGAAKSLLPEDVFGKIARASGLPSGLGHKYYEEWRLPGTSPGRKRELEKLSRAYYETIRRVKL